MNIKYFLFAEIADIVWFVALLHLLLILDACEYSSM